jgi:hypothetical protein
VWIDLDEDKILNRWKQEHQSAANFNTPAATRKRHRETPGTVEGYGTAMKAQRLEASSNSKKSRSPQISDHSLLPTGKLACRLDNCRQHLPMTAKAAGKPHAKCSLHRWALGRAHDDVRNNLLFCSDCYVVLCVDCFSVFHTEEDIVNKKEDLRKMMEKELLLKKEFVWRKKQPHADTLNNDRS